MMGTPWSNKDCLAFKCFGEQSTGIAMLGKVGVGGGLDKEGGLEQRHCRGKNAIVSPASCSFIKERKRKYRPL